jgi:hypothetical protein
MTDAIPDNNPQPMLSRVAVKAGQSPRYIEPRPKSRIRAGKKVLPTAHPQSVWCRLMRDVQGSIVQHLGGEGYVSETQKLAARRVATLEAELVFLEDAFANARTAGEVPPPADLTLYSTMANAQRRFCEALGWRPMQRDVTPTLSQFIDGLAREKAAGELNTTAGPPETENRTSDQAKAEAGQ